MKKKKKLSFSKQLIKDIRGLLWTVTIGGILLAFYSIYKNYGAELPWIVTMTSLPWTAHGVICSFYMNKSKQENTSADGNGIVYAAAEARDFIEEDYSYQSPPI